MMNLRISYAAEPGAVPTHGKDIKIGANFGCHYEHHLKLPRGQNVRMYSIGITDSDKESYRILSERKLSLILIEVETDLKTFLTENDVIRKRQILLELLQSILLKFVNHRGWDPAPYYKAYEKVVEDGFIFSYTGRKIKHPDNKRSFVQLKAVWEQDRVMISCGLYNGRQLKKEVLVFECFDGILIVNTLMKGYLYWEDDTTVCVRHTSGDIAFHIDLDSGEVVTELQPHSDKKTFKEVELDYKILCADTPHEERIELFKQMQQLMFRRMGIEKGLRLGNFP